MKSGATRSITPYPMPDKAHCQNALARWSDAANQAMYSQPEQFIINKRITSRAKKPWECR